MFRWAVDDDLGRGAGGADSAEQPDRASGVRVVGRGLIELILRDELGSREVEGRGLIKVEIGLGRAPSGGHPGRPMRQVEVEEDGLHGGREGDERDDPHLTPAGGTQEREHLVDPSQELRPEDAARC